MQSIPENQSECNNSGVAQKLIDRLEALSELPWPRCRTEWARGHKFRARFPCRCALCGVALTNVRVLIHDGDERRLYVGEDCAKTALLGPKGGRRHA
jgi:hypothetical protein